MDSLVSTEWLAEHLGDPDFVKNPVLNRLLVDAPSGVTT